MNEPFFQPTPEFQRLLADLLDGGLSDADGQRLAEMLRDNAAAQDAYRNVMAVHALLHLDFSVGRLQLLPSVRGSLSALLAAEEETQPAMSGSMASDPQGASAGQKEAATALQPRRANPTRRELFWRPSIAMAAVAAAVLLAVWSVWRQPPTAVPHGSAPMAAAPAEQRAEQNSDEDFAAHDIRAVAVLGQASRPAWSDPRLPLAVGASLPAGKFRLVRGLVQIEFFRGASVIIQAPAEFELVSSNHIICELGRVRAHVPSQAKGFTITTPIYTAVDLGTEFTVQVEPTGESQFAVLDGEVELWDSRRDESTLAQRLTAGQGVRSTADGELVEMPMGESTIVGRREMLEMAAAALRERYGHWQRFSDEIRSVPDTILYYGFDGHAPWERVLRNDAPSGAETLDGAIVGCQWTTGRWTGKQALEFKRTTDRVRVNVPGEFESLTFAAWLRIEGLERWLSSLMLTDGHQLGEVHWQMTDRGQLMLGVKAESERSHDFYSPSVIGPTDLGRWVHLACVYDGKEGYVSHFVDGVEVSREDVRLPTKLRIGPAEIGNWVPEDLEDYRIRSLNGRIDEFMLFSAPLTQDAIQAIYEAGRPQA